ncbi:MAG: tetratricopeptide repeat protein [Planctomycetaceae bacterium]|nr:tetratricopeptide repeat protein [Planctomycetaceae bacterium]
MSDEDYIWRFSPCRTDPELLETIFVQREALLVDLLERVTESATTASKHHVLLIGPRGFGKTHLITLLNHRLSKHAAISDRIRVAWLLEEETITSFVQLLKRIYEVLAQQYPTEFPLDWLHDLLAESPTGIQRQLEGKLVESFASRTLLLCIENLDFQFSGLGTNGQHDWRAFLQEHPFTTIIASTQRLFVDVKSREKPFFGFFSPVPLEPLSVSDAVELMRRVAANRKATDLVAFLDSAEGRSRVRALHHLAGGNHRIYVVLAGFISRDSLNELIGPFQKMADELTPYYQERLRWLSPQQRQIVEHLCSQDQPCMPRQIARQLLATESTISSQLKKLLEIGYVLRSEAGRESRYELAEPLMRLASEVKEPQRRPLKLLVNFLRVWYRPKALPELMHRAGTDSLRRHIAAAIEDAKINPDQQIRILIDAIEKARAEGNFSELLQALEEKAHMTNTAQDWFHLAYVQSEIAKDHRSAVVSYDHVIKLDPGQTWPLIEKGYALHQLKRYEEELACYERALIIDSDDALLWNNKGSSLHELRRYDEAVACFVRAVELDPRTHQQLFNLAGSLFAIGRYAEGLAQLRAAMARFSHIKDLDEPSMIDSLRRAFSVGNELVVRQFADLFHEFNRISRLGDGLVRSLAKIDLENTTHDSLNRWLDFWEHWGSTHVEMEVPLRLFRTGIGYLIKQDRKMLLDLVLSERQLVAQVLEIEVS